MFVKLTDEENVAYSAYFDDKDIPEVFEFGINYYVSIYFPRINTVIAEDLSISTNYVYDILAGRHVIGSLIIDEFEVDDETLGQWERLT